MLPLVLLPGLLAAGIGSIVFLGMGTVTGLSTSAYALDLLGLPPRPGPDDRRVRGGHRPGGARRDHRSRPSSSSPGRSEGVVMRRPFVLIPAAGLVVAALAIVFVQLTGQSADADPVLRPGRDGLAGRPRADAERRRRSPRSSCSRAWPGASRSAASAAARPSRRCSSGWSAGCSWPTCSGCPRRR